ncbi:FxLD family lanthipeptide [Actinacidiphila rubida]|uniref:FxLD family lantipeptide n=1 Tax=Actinacidiphila rubida TaxID=310780 RepID=A0A1H8TR62_9ACTN|nr:FxLD family lanthipeptide [Actinacidiphila rubida]SEO93492.1 FxLD family lantipeptide [Actinacidiphila rubida]
MTTATLAPAPTDVDGDFAPLDVRVVVATHAYGKLACSTGDGCGSTCANGASSCNSSAEYPA